MFWNLSYFSTNLNLVQLCLPLFTFVQLTHLCTNFVLVKQFFIKDTIIVCLYNSTQGTFYLIFRKLITKSVNFGQNLPHLAKHSTESWIPRFHVLGTLLLISILNGIYLSAVYHVYSQRNWSKTSMHFFLETLYSNKLKVLKNLYRQSTSNLLVPKGVNISLHPS